jgi:deoxyribodipyrimidine photolyase-related protein
MGSSAASSAHSGVRGAAADGFGLPPRCRRLVLVLGDQLFEGHPGLAAFDAAHDCVLMAEAAGEARHVWSHQVRIAIFLSAMRHFRAGLAGRGWPCAYLPIDADGLPHDLAGRIGWSLAHCRADELVACEPGEWRIQQAIEQVAADAGVPLRWLPDPHFACPREDFARWAAGQNELRMEPFYRSMRRRCGVLMEGDRPAGGRWNFDTENRHGFGPQGPGLVPAPVRFEPDAITREVIALVRERFGEHPGSLEAFGWPVTRAQALEALDDFLQQRLPAFGPFQDAMWTGEPWAYHALLSSSLNLHLLSPLEVVRAAEDAWRRDALPLASVEGFIRQVLGWREYIRGIYWLDMPGLAQANHWDHHRDLPAWYWTGETGMHCMRQAIGQTLEHGFAHHIQRLMVTGQFGLLAGIEPRQLCDWYLAVYVDAVEWAELPNTIGLALNADGGRFTSKPYIASGQYIARMSNYCDGCRYRPQERTGERACPFTTLFWAFLDRHEQALLAQPRTAPMARNLDRLPAEERAALRAQAERMLANLDGL